MICVILKPQFGDNYCKGKGWLSIAELQFMHVHQSLSHYDIPIVCKFMLSYTIHMIRSG